MRHGRSSFEFLPQGSLYNAMQAIIGAGLRERYSISEQLPTDLKRLVKALNGAHPVIKKTPSDLTLGAART
jgi:hypothetical protein